MERGDNVLIYLIGGAGFVGSAYARLFDRLGVPYTLLQRGDLERLRGTTCDVIINANGNSKKFLSDQDPLYDFDASVRSVMESLVAVNAGLYVLLSSGDVYPDQSAPSLTDESLSIDLARLSRYALHKHLAEQLVQGTAPRWLIVRMGGFVGPGLKKNAIFDMLANRPVWLHPDSELQFIHTDHAAALVWQMIGAGVVGEIVNLGARGLVHLEKLHRHLNSQSVFLPDARKVRYELALDKLARLAGVELPSSEDEVLRFVEQLARASERDCVLS